MGLLLSACMSNNRTKGVLSLQEIEQQDQLYGERSSEVFAKMNLSEEMIDRRESSSGKYRTNRTRSICSQDFSELLLFSINPESFSGVMFFVVLEDDPPEISNIINEIYDSIKNEYGEPSTYPGMENRISECSAEIIKSVKTNKSKTYSDNWVLSASTLLTYSVECSNGQVVLYLKYSMPPIPPK